MTDQVSTGLRGVLAVPRIYSWAQSLLGGDRTRQVLVDEYLGPLAEADVIDLGCGPADLLPYLGAKRYVGYDPSAAYIAAARRNHGTRGEFHVAGVDQVARLEPGRFDLAIAIGVVHHLDDATAAALFQAARTVLLPGGRLVTFDGVFVPRQRRIARALARLDRGQHVRDAGGYAALARTAFSQVDVHLRHDLLRVPYDHVVLTCTA